MSQPHESKNHSKQSGLDSKSLNSLVEDFIIAAHEVKTTSVTRQNLPPPRVENGASYNAKLAAAIDHTLLKADTTSAEIQRICAEALQYRFATVCVNSSFVGQVAELLAGSSSLPISVVGFPLGATSTASKVFETCEAIREGAREIDMVIQLGALKGREYDRVYDDIRRVVEAAGKIPVKVILETAALTRDEKIVGCALAKAAGAAFVKTSTGFGVGGATAEDVSLMRAVVGPEMGVKASGGIRNLEDALRMLSAGANRIGASSSVAIVTSEESAFGPGPGTLY